MPWTIERRHDHVAVVTMNTNKVNVQNPAFFADLHMAFDRLETEFADCAVVLTGTGAVFSAGLDLDHHFAMFARRSLKEIDDWFAAYRATNLRLFTYPRPTVAAINGHAYAGGLITALGCDHRIATKGDSRFSLNEVPIGIPMPAVYCEIIKYAVGSRGASELTLFGQIYDLAAALRMKIVQATSMPDKLLEAAIDWAARVPADCYAAYGFSKRALQATTMAAIDSAARLDRDLLSRSMSDPASLCAQTRRYRDLKGRDITWPLPT
ncbi:enoyl-CoA hydratase/isomerase family protein [Reyranella sp.]|uniref:enoyl-CoA hydratase/isomerase family protein n=1 Tax=Reyranella sp. TaxID=1929291 RepID=UPI0037836EDA